MSPHDLTDHFINRAIVVEQARVLFVPMPKSACSSIMWALAEVAGIPAEHFHRSTVRETTLAMTIHDMEIWGPENSLMGRSDDDLDRLLNEDGWFRFTVVREPVERLWSAWQSKVLAREPQMLRSFGETEWFPRVPDNAAEIVDDYRLFVGALGEGVVEDDVPTLGPAMFNSHWVPQTALMGEAGFNALQVTKLSDLSETLGWLMKHLADVGLPEPTVPNLNTSLLSFAEALNGPAERDAIRRLYRADFEILDFTPPDNGDVGDLGGWMSQVEPLLGAIQSVVERNERIERLATEAQNTARGLERSQARVEKARQTLRQRSAALASAQASSGRMSRRLGALAEKEQATDAMLRQAGESLSIARANLGFAQSMASEAAQRASDSEQRLDAMEQDLTWRWTSPIRRVGVAWRQRFGNKGTGGAS